jgi:hypothetical protein
VPARISAARRSKTTARHPAFSGEGSIEVELATDAHNLVRQAGAALGRLLLLHLKVL